MKSVRLILISVHRLALLRLAAFRRWQARNMADQAARLLARADDLDRKAAELEARAFEAAHE